MRFVSTRLAFSPMRLHRQQTGSFSMFIAKLFFLERRTCTFALLALALCQAQAQAQVQAPTSTASTSVAPGKPTTAQAVALTATPSTRRRTPTSPPPQVAIPIHAESLSLTVGEIRMLPMPGKVTRVALGNGAFVSATAVDQHLMLIGEQLGQTSLMVWSGSEVRSFKVQVQPADASRTRQLVERVIGDQKGLRIEDLDAQRIVVSGVANRDLLTQLQSLAKDLPSVVLNVRAEEASAQVRSVLFRLHFVEVNKSLLQKLGIQWNKDAQGPVIGAQGVTWQEGLYRGIPPAQTGANLLDGAPAFVSRNGTSTGIFFGLATTIASRINLGLSDGDARILASPELTARSGGKARLQVGGEVPIPMAGAFGATTVEFKPYGIILSIEPTIDGDGVISAKVSTELSQIDPSVSVAGIPGFLTRSTSTEISVKPGEMVALSGLVNSELSTAIDKIPGLGNIPILGRLFRSDDFRNKKSDLVVLLEPEIITPGQGIADQLRQRGAQHQKEFIERSKPEEPKSRQPTEDRSLDLYER